MEATCKEAPLATEVSERPDCCAKHSKYVPVRRFGFRLSVASVLPACTTLSAVCSDDEEKESINPSQLFSLSATWLPGASPLTVSKWGPEPSAMRSNGSE